MRTAEETLTLHRSGVPCMGTTPGHRITGSAQPASPAYVCPSCKLPQPQPQAVFIQTTGRPRPQHTAKPQLTNQLVICAPQLHAPAPRTATHLHGCTLSHPPPPPTCTLSHQG